MEQPNHASAPTRRGGEGKSVDSSTDLHYRAEDDERLWDRSSLSPVSGRLAEYHAWVVQWVRIAWWSKSLLVHNDLRNECLLCCLKAQGAGKDSLSRRLEEMRSESPWLDGWQQRIASGLNAHGIQRLSDFAQNHP